MSEIRAFLLLGTERIWFVSFSKKMRMGRECFLPVNTSWKVNASEGKGAVTLKGSSRRVNE